ncbi:hypothetical protein AB6A40_004306 [Gnathostoma spinigerum]|uniref:Uncharacterized protein n=1 Tax=Gnathostoma spinigerum TaxID=75299 RepID=A0ABD6ELK2_9BILA
MIEWMGEIGRNYDAKENAEMWRHKLLAKLRSCSTWMENRSDVTNVQIRQLDSLLQQHRFVEYRSLIMDIAANDSYSNETSFLTSECFKTFASVDEKIRHLSESNQRTISQPERPGMRSSKHHSRQRSEIEKWLTRWQLRKLHSYLRRTGDSDSIINALRQHFRHLPQPTQESLIIDFFQFSPSLKRPAISMLKRSSLTLRQFLRQIFSSDDNKMELN